MTKSTPDVLSFYICLVFIVKLALWVCIYIGLSLEYCTTFIFYSQFNPFHFSVFLLHTIRSCFKIKIVLAHSRHFTFRRIHMVGYMCVCVCSMSVIPVTETKKKKFPTVTKSSSSLLVVLYKNLRLRLSYPFRLTETLGCVNFDRISHRYRVGAALPVDRHMINRCH